MTVLQSFLFITLILNIGHFKECPLVLFVQILSHIEFHHFCLIPERIFSKGTCQYILLLAILTWIGQVAVYPFMHYKVTIFSLAN